MLSDIKIPRCPECQADAMFHRCVSHVRTRPAFKKNGWYCEECKAGPYQLYLMADEEAAEAQRKALHDYWENLTWTCMVCGEERPDKFISVDSHQFVTPEGVEFACNVRYCNDRPECKAGAKDHKLFKLGKEITSGT